ncbi:MAG: acetamidase/formamidase family protein [Chloroflexota bacterium]
MKVTTPTIHVRRHQFNLAWDNSIPPVATVKSGEVVSLDTLDASGGQLSHLATLVELGALDFAKVNPVFGPVAIEGAEPGDTLQVELLELQPADWGWTANIPGFGLLAGEFPDAQLIISRVGSDVAEFLPGIRIPLQPFCGEIGVAPRQPGALSTIPPYESGGNLDTRHMTAGTTLYLPVFVPGALFSLGDGHAAQGDGEVCGTAIETPMQVTVRLTVRKDLHLAAPEFLTAGPLAARTNVGRFYATNGIGPDLFAAAGDAVRRMLDYLGREHGMTPIQAYLLSSVAADLKISEVVDAPNWVVSAYLPLSIFG